MPSRLLHHIKEWFQPQDPATKDYPFSTLGDWPTAPAPRTAPRRRKRKEDSIPKENKAEPHDRHAEFRHHAGAT